MSECTCHKNYTEDVLIPQVGVITDIRQETPDVKTFRVNAPEGGKLFEHMPGQCAMLCVPGVSEGMFSITSSPTNKEYQEFSIKKCGSLTEMLHSLEVGDEITVRGPYGNHFPVEDYSAAQWTKALAYLTGQPNVWGSPEELRARLCQVLSGP